MVGFLDDDQLEEEPTLRLNFNRAQMDAWLAPEPYLGLCFGIRGGKTFFGRNWIVDRVRRFPRSQHIATANSYDQLRLVTISNIRDALNAWGLPFRHLEGKKKFEVRVEGYTAELHYRSMDNFDLTRGAEFGSAWMDEMRDTKPGALEMMKGRLSCGLVDQPKLLCTTTPNGFDAFYQEFSANAKPGVHFFRRSRTRDNPHLPRQYVERIYDDYGADLAAQELDADFRVMGAGKAYSSYTRERNGQGNDYNPDLPLWLCVDFNWNNQGWVLAQITGQGEIHAIDEIVRSGYTLPKMANELARTWGGKHKGPWCVTGDATNGTNRHSGKSDWAMLRESLAAVGIHASYHQPNSNPLIRDRLNAVNRCFRSAAGISRLFHHPRCKELQMDFEQLVTKGGEVDKDKDQKRSHTSDALGYLVAQKHPATGPTLFQGIHLTA